MAAQLAIEGHKTRGKEVIEILEMLGGSNKHNYSADCDSLCFYIGKGGNTIYYDWVNSCYEDEGTLIFSIEEFLEKFPYKVGDRVKNARINDFIGRITNVRWDENEKQIIYVVEWDDIAKSTLTYFARGLQPYKEETMEEIKIDIPKGYEFSGVDDDKQQVVFTKIQPEYKYPKTYKECIGQLPINWDGEVKGYKCELLVAFQKLLIARDVYWKIAGEQMGLGKPWEPNWDNGDEEKFCIEVRNDNELCDITYLHAHRILAFPTMELLDIFAENFKELIEQCKELL